MKHFATIALSTLCLGAAFTATTQAQEVLWLDTLDLTKVQQDFGRARPSRSVDNKPISIGGKTYERGIGTHARSEFTVDLKGVATRFDATVGVDDEIGIQGSVVFIVTLDGKRIAESPRMVGGGSPHPLTADLTGGKRLTLVVEDAGDGITYDHADWAEAKITLVPGAKKTPTMLEPPPQPVPQIAMTKDGPKPAIHGPRIVGATPGHDLLFLIPATGAKPLKYSATGLPAGLTLDSKTGIITGRVAQPTEAIATLTVENNRGKATRKLKIVIGQNKLALTPPLGWNSWNVWGCAVDQGKVHAAVDAMKTSGLAEHGFQYVNIDDCWQGTRDAAGVLGTNQKFPDIKGLADYTHSLGLKLGTYSGPGPTTCAGYAGSWQHTDIDAKTYAEWGIDYLKYDWCSYGDVATGEGLARLKLPYEVMRDSLAKCGRDIVYSLCQYGMGDVWTWGADVNGNCWRTTGDITDTWSSMAGIGFSQDGHEKFAGPGHWNDPDMLVVGKVGWGPNIHPTRLTPNEQVTHMTLWVLQSSPLLIGCDMTQLDPFTLSLLTNDDVLDVSQDPLGRPAGRKAADGELEVWARPLWDGTIAVGLFNRGADKAKVTAKFSDLGIGGEQPVRDLWRKKDLGSRTGSFTAEVNGHGAVLVKIGKPTRTDW